MKQYKSYKWQAIIALFFVFLYGCQDNNEPELLFDDLPSVRVKKKIAEVKSFLQSSENGWKVTYFPDDTQLGGYTFLFNFISDNEVKMDSDFGVVDTTKTSLYDITFGSTVKLSFTTKNVIHQLSDGASFPGGDLRGQGYRGDFEFLFSSIEGDDIIFRSNRDASNYLRFKKASSSDWTDLSKNRVAIEQNINNVKLAFGTEDKQYEFSYNNIRRFAASINADDSDLSFGIGFTPTGIVVSPEIEVNGTKYSEFTLDIANEHLISLDGNLVILIISPPINMKQDWSIVADDTNVSPSFLGVFNQIKAANTNRWSETLSQRILLGNTTIRGITAPGILFQSDQYLSQFILNFGGILGESDQLDISKSAGAFNWSFYTHLTPLVDLIVDNAPYKLELSLLDNPTDVKLVSTIDSNVWFYIRR